MMVPYPDRLKESKLQTFTLFLTYPVKLVSDWGPSANAQRPEGEAGLIMTGARRLRQDRWPAT